MELQVRANAEASRRQSAVAPGVAWAVVATCFWSSSALLVERLTRTYGMSPLHVSVWRVVLALPLVASLVAVRRRPLSIPWRSVPLYVAFGVFGVTFSYLGWTTSVKLNSAPVAAALGFSAPVFVAIGDRLFFDTRLKPVQVAAIGVNLAGCGLVANLHSPADLWQRPEGLAVGLGVGVAFGGYSLLGRATAGSRRIDPLVSLLYLFGFGELGLLLFSLPVDGVRTFQVDLPPQGWVMLVGLALGPTILANGLYNLSLRSLPATLATLCTSLEPVLVAIAAAVLLGHMLSPVQILGIALVVGAVLVMQLDAVMAAPPRMVADGDRF